MFCQARFRNIARRHLQQILRHRLEFSKLPVDLVWSRHQPVKNFRGHGNQSWMRYPRTVMSIARFPFFVCAHLGNGFLIRHWITLDRNERRHSPHGMNVSPVTRADQQLAVRAQEMRGHGNLRAVRKHRVRIV